MMTRARRDTSPSSRVWIPREGLDLTPIFHSYGHFDSVDYTDGTTGDELVTRCGLLVYRYERDRGLTKNTTNIRLDHAEAFATPCQRCWPPVVQ